MTDINKTGLNQPSVVKPAEKADNKKGLVIGAGAGLLGGGAVGGFVRKNAKVQDADILVLMKNEDSVKARITPEGQAKEILLAEMDSDVNKLQSIAAKYDTNNSIEPDDIKLLNKYGIESVEDLSAKTIKGAAEDLKMESHFLGYPDLKTAAEKAHAQIIEELTESKSFITDLFDLNKKIQTEKLSADAIKTQTELVFNKYKINKQVVRPLDYYCEFVTKPEAEMVKTIEPECKTKDELFKVMESSIKEEVENKEAFIRSFSEDFKESFSEFEENVKAKAKSIKPLDDKGVLDNPKFKAVREEAEKILKSVKSAKFKKGIAIGALAGTAIGAIVAFALPKTKAE